MRKQGLTMAALLLTLSMMGFAGEDIVGTWEGVKEDGRYDREFPWGPVEITRTSTGELKVRIVSLINDDHSYNLPKPSWHHGKLVSKGRLDIEAKLDHHGHLLVGHMKHHGMTEKFKLTRLKPRTADQIVAAFHKDPARAEIPAQSQFLNVLETKGIGHARAIMEAVRKREGHPQVFSAHTINQLGYAYLNKEQYEKAIEVLKLNVTAYPDDANSYDSLGEAYVTAGKRELAIEALKTSLSKNPKDHVRENSLKLLKKLGIEESEAIN